MKALTLKQPWASLVIHYVDPEAKRVENRHQPPPKSVLGERIAIHAGKAWDRNVPKKHDRALLRLADQLVARGYQGWPFGAFLGTVVISDFIKRRQEFSPGEPQMRWYLEGMVGLLLEDARDLAVPIPYRGQLGYWNVPPMIQAALEVLPEREPGTGWGRGVFRG